MKRNWKLLLQKKPKKDLLEQLESKKKGIFDKMDQKFQENREKMEQEALDSKRIDISQKQKADQFFGVEQNLKERERLIKEALVEGYFDNAKMVAKKGAKLWEAPIKQRPMHLCPKLPFITGDWMDRSALPLQDRIMNHSVSLVSFVYNQFGQEHVASFIDPFLNEFQSNERAGLFEVVVNEQYVKSPLVKLMIPYMRWKMDIEKRKRTMMVFENLRDKRRSIGMNNNALGWIHLVDRNGFIRWQAHGVATPLELETMSKISNRIINKT